MIVWPANLDSTRSRKAGRKLMKGAAIQNPRLEEINEAAKKLSIDSESVRGKSRPGAWWDKGGYLIFPNNEKRSTLLRSLASEIRKARAAKYSER